MNEKLQAGLISIGTAVLTSSAVSQCNVRLNLGWLEAEIGAAKKAAGNASMDAYCVQNPGECER